jgi:hypothetical protein
LLPSGQVRIVGTVGYGCGEIFNSVDLIFRQERPAKLCDVQPFVGSALQSAVIEIESVDVNVRSHKRSPEKAEAVTACAVTASRPTLEKGGGVDTTSLNVTKRELNVKQNFISNVSPQLQLD